MIAVMCSKAGFEYDIHSLVKAFYPECDVKVFVEGEKQYSSTEGLPDISLHFEEDCIMLGIMQVGEEKNTSAFQGMKIEISEQMERPEVKNSLKQLLYTGLSGHTEKTLPWGTLTGIRPTKIPMMLLEEGKDKEEILDYMKETYLVSDEKGVLSIEIAQREKELLSTLHYKDGYSLYIGIPFCPTTCLYCSFTSYPIVSWKKRMEEYLSALEKEIDFTAEIYKDKILDTVYIGGGTPTTLEAEELDRLLGYLKEKLDFSHVKEFTVEAGRADSITKEKLEVLKKWGVTRISVNPQTMHDETLKLIGRQHTVEQAKEAYRLAREVGFDNINMDLILGLPGEGEEEVASTIEQVKELAPDSLTVHSLAIKRGSKLYQWIDEHGITALNNTDKTMEIAAKGAADLDMVPYYLYRQKNMSGNFENVGYAKEGKFGIYNILIMEEKQTIVALGAGSITKRVYEDGRIERCDNVKDVALYIEKIDEMIERKRKLLEEYNIFG
ncbi:MAG: coproporphyrinogen dehydrogenase HemZ [Lachnospiraceae bacterium]|nr:coproporphyrinogen dehydrogenase HemZ [Lachnospiraceae bacterium]